MMTMKKKEMLINVLQSEECRIAVVENGVLEELYVERASHENYTGNIYKGRVVNIEPGFQAAFVDFSVGRNGFLHVSDVDPQYFQPRGGSTSASLVADGSGEESDPLASPATPRPARGRDRDRDLRRGRDRGRGERPDRMDRSRYRRRPFPSRPQEPRVFGEGLTGESGPLTPLSGSEPFGTTSQAPLPTSPPRPAAEHGVISSLPSTTTPEPAAPFHPAPSSFGWGLVQETSPAAHQERVETRSNDLAEDRFGAESLRPRPSRDRGEWVRSRNWTRSEPRPVTEPTDFDASEGDVVEHPPSVAATPRPARETEDPLYETADLGLELPPNRNPRHREAHLAEPSVLQAPEDREPTASDVPDKTSPPPSAAVEDPFEAEFDRTPARRRDRGRSRPSLKEKARPLPPTSASVPTSPIEAAHEETVGPTSTPSRRTDRPGDLGSRSRPTTAPSTTPVSSVYPHANRDLFAGDEDDIDLELAEELEAIQETAVPEAFDEAVAFDNRAEPRELPTSLRGRQAIRARGGDRPAPHPTAPIPPLPPPKLRDRDIGSQTPSATSPPAIPPAITPSTRARSLSPAPPRPLRPAAPPIPHGRAGEPGYVPRRERTRLASTAITPFDTETEAQTTMEPRRDVAGFEPTLEPPASRRSLARPEPTPGHHPASRRGQVKPEREDQFDVDSEATIEPEERIETDLGLDPLVTAPGSESETDSAGRRRRRRRRRSRRRDRGIETVSQPRRSMTEDAEFDDLPTDLDEPDGEFEEELESPAPAQSPVRSEREEVQSAHPSTTRERLPEPPFDTGGEREPAAETRRRLRERPAVDLGPLYEHRVERERSVDRPRARTEFGGDLIEEESPPQTPAPREPRGRGHRAMPSLPAPASPSRPTDRHDDEFAHPEDLDSLDDLHDDLEEFEDEDEELEDLDEAELEDFEGLSEDDDDHDQEVEDQDHVEVEVDEERRSALARRPVDPEDEIDPELQEEIRREIEEIAVLEAEMGLRGPDGRYKRGEDRAGTVIPGSRTRGVVRPPIQEIFRRGDEVIVQVIKESIGNKGPTLSTYISIPGRYLVLMPGLNRVGVSRKINDEAQRRKLKEIMEELNPPNNLGFIVRTAGVDRTKKELARDMAYLLRLWKAILRRIKRTQAPAVIYQESDMITRTIRDVFSDDIDTIWIDERQAYEHAREFLQNVMPRYVDRLKLYEGKTPLFHLYGLEEEIQRIHRKHVPLPGGGSIIIEPTEALVAIDVNSGNFRVENDAEKTAYETNLRAAKEIARQLRLRDLGGVIINDFIDMREEKHRRGVERALREAIKRDRARTKVLRMSQFGIIEMTRQRIRPSLKRSVYQDCPHCQGTGLIKTPESLSIEVMRLLALAAHRPEVRRLVLTVSTPTAEYLANKKRKEIAQLEIEGNLTIEIRATDVGPGDQLKLECFDQNGVELRSLIPGGPSPVTSGAGYSSGLAALPTPPAGTGYGSHGVGSSSRRSGY